MLTHAQLKTQIGDVGFAVVGLKAAGGFAAFQGLLGLPLLAIGPPLVLPLPRGLLALRLSAFGPQLA